MKALSDAIAARDKQMNLIESMRESMRESIKLEIIVLEELQTHLDKMYDATKRHSLRLKHSITESLYGNVTNVESNFIVRDVGTHRDVSYMLKFFSSHPTALDDVVGLLILNGNQIVKLTTTPVEPSVGNWYTIVTK